VTRVTLTVRHFLAAEEPGYRLAHFDVVVDCFVFVDIQGVLFDSFKVLDISTFSQILDAMLSLFFYGLKAFFCLLQITPREVQLFFVWKMKHDVSRLASTFRIEFNPAHLWIIYRKAIDRELFEPLALQVTNLALLVS